MNTLIIGHRGSGKTCFLSRVQSYLSNARLPAQCFDLDREIEIAEARSIANIFAESGEPAFREIEKRTLAAIVARCNGEAWVAAGAGLEAQAPEGWRVLWLSRPSDQIGRIFLDRPRLDPDRRAYEEFHDRKTARDRRFASVATERLALDEGFDFANDPERLFVTGELRDVGGYVTMMPWMAKKGLLHQAVDRWRRYGVARIEFRDDILDADAVEQGARSAGPHLALLSAREGSRATQTAAHAIELGCALDWASELGPVPAGVQPYICSIHERRVGESFTAALERASQAHIESGSKLIKLSLFTQDFGELALGEAWRAEDPGRRAFLPRSKNGRWTWYRLATKVLQPLGFWREGDNGSAPDQPPLFRWQRASGRAAFLAVLGQPVEHSRTPAEHCTFAESLALDGYAIEVSPQEWDDGALEILRALGLRFAAVTAPLKERAFSVCANVDDVAREMRAVNSLALERDGSWIGANTDFGGLQVAWAARSETRQSARVAIWGGGGTLAVARAALPSAVAFSARTGLVRDFARGEQAVGRAWMPESVVWAVGRYRMCGTVWPPSDWRPDMVFDLNYSEDSPGLEYAASISAKYVSGLAMFKEQASLQREFWRKHV